MKPEPEPSRRRWSQALRSDRLHSGTGLAFVGEQAEKGDREREDFPQPAPGSRAPLERTSSHSDTWGCLSSLTRGGASRIGVRRQRGPWHPEAAQAPPGVAHSHRGT